MDEDKHNYDTYFDDISPKTINSRLKTGASFLASNFAAIAFVAAAAIIIATTWLDIKIANILSVRFAANAVVTMITYCTVQMAMQDKGKTNGKADPEYRRERAEYLAKREQIIRMGSPRIDEFCTWSINASLKRHISALLCRHCKGLKYDEWYSYFRPMDKRALVAYCKSIRHKSEQELAHYPLRRRQIPALLAVRKMKPAKLTPEMMVLEEADVWRNDGIAPSPAQIISRKNKYTLAASVASAVFGVSLTLSIMANPSLDSMIYAGIQLFLLCQRAVKGYSVGCLAYSVSGVAYHVSQRQKCEEYLAWLDTNYPAKTPEQKQSNTQDSIVLASNPSTLA